METWGTVFAGSAGAPGLAEPGLALSEPWEGCLRRGSTAHRQSLEPAPFTAITDQASWLALGTLRAPLPEV